MINRIKLELSKIAFKDLAIMILLSIVLYQLIYNRSEPVKFDNTETLQKIQLAQNDIIKLNQLLTNSKNNIYRLEKLIEKNNRNTLLIKTNLSNEKIKLDNLSNDDNVHYFHNYIINYRLQSK